MHLHPDRMQIVGGAEEHSFVRRGDLVALLSWIKSKSKGKSKCKCKGK
jgi:hypothetical protein